MLQDVSAVMWKEYKEVFARRGVRTISLFVTPILLMGIFLPWQMGTEWLTSPVGMLIWAWLPAFLVVSIVADSFAGERERHTLETLLASRLPDRAILLGKISTVVLYSWSMTLAGIAVALVTTNLAFGGNGLLMYSPDTLLVGVIMNALVALMTTTTGVLISLRSSTVRQAQQTLSLLFIGPTFGLIFGVQAIPADIKTEIIASLGNLNTGNIIPLAIGLIALIDIGLILLAQNRFKRSKLAID